MNSFYGGKEGRTYHIVKSFPRIQDMVTEFSKGAGYTKVSYGEYVLIDAISNNDKDNGRIYRRGLNYSQNATTNYKYPGGGAIYIGQIQGPDGKIPPIQIANWSTFTNLYKAGQSAGTTFSKNGVTYKVYNDASTFSPPTTKKAIDWGGEEHTPSNATTNQIKIGFEDYTDLNQIKINGVIGIDIPQPVVHINDKILPASSSGTIDPITQTTYSQELVDNGVQYYEYDVNIPIPSNFEIKRSGGTGINSTYSLQYNTPTESNTYTVASSTVDFNLVDGMRYAPNNKDLIQYHLSGNNGGWFDLFNPNGQFHIYAKHDWTNEVAENELFDDEKAVNKLNLNYKWGIRSRIDESNTYDLSQAGWLISVELEKWADEQQTQKKKYSALYAYNYISKTGKQYTLEDFAHDELLPYKADPEGWFQVQDFNSSLASEPGEIVLLGTLEDVQDEQNTLKQNGLWLQGYQKDGNGYSTKGGKWWW